jgi:hypothetical protein
MVHHAGGRIPFTVRPMPRPRARRIAGQMVGPDCLIGPELPDDPFVMDPEVPIN